MKENIQKHKHIPKIGLPSSKVKCLDPDNENDHHGGGTASEGPAASSAPLAPDGAWGGAAGCLW